MAYNFNSSHFYVPEMLESMFGYVSQQHEHVTGDTVEKVLTCAYNLGYTPASLEALDYAALVLLRYVSKATTCCNSLILFLCLQRL